MAAKMMKITNSKQFELLMSILEEKPCLARGFSKGIDKINFTNEWELLATKLNSLGPPIRQGEGWQKVWADMKFKIKRKLIYNKNEQKATGGGKFSQHILSPLEESVAELMAFEKIVNPQGTAFGVSPSPSSSNVLSPAPSTPNFLPPAPSTATFVPPAPSSLHALTDVANVEQSSNDACPAGPRSAPKCLSTRRSKTKTQSTKENKENIWRRQINLQDNLYREVKRSLRRIEIYTKNTEKHQRKMVSLEEERLKLYKEELQRNAEQAYEDTKLREDELEIQKRKLELKAKQLQLIAEN